MPSSPDLFTKTSLNDLLSLTAEQKCMIINTLWPHASLHEEDYISENYENFFEFVGKSLQGLSPHANQFAARDLSGFLTLIGTLVANRSLTRKELIIKLRTQYLNIHDADIARSIELGIRIWLGINVSSKDVSVGQRNPRDSRIDWRDDEPLNVMVQHQFRPMGSRTISSDVALEGSFTAVNLKSICRLNIRWTDNLADHLRLEGPRGQRSLSIYRHKACLINHRNAYDCAIPRKVLEEAIRSLNLLFPFGDPKTDDFLAAERVYLHGVDAPDLVRATDLDDFKYWRNNLAQLLNLLNGPPETVVQTLLDTRNLPQFATLWVAIFGVFCLTILFGIFSTVYAVKQYKLAIKSYDLCYRTRIYFT